MNRTPPLIAVVDDEESIRKAVKRLLRSAGMEVETFSSGELFLDAIKTRSISCAVLDLHMNGVNGFDVLAQLSTQDIHLPIIVMTGHDTPDTRTRAMARGAVTYLLKPVDELELLDAIKKAVAQNQA